MAILFGIYFVFCSHSLQNMANLLYLQQSKTKQEGVEVVLIKVMHTYYILKVLVSCFTLLTGHKRLGIAHHCVSCTSY